MLTIASYNYAYNEHRNIINMSVEEVNKIVANTPDFSGKEWEIIPSLFEVLYNNDMVKIFMDIENYHCDDYSLFKEIIADFKKYFHNVSGKKLGSYVLTKNFNSRHPGGSFHVIFSGYKLRLENLKKLIWGFLEKNEKYNGIIDGSVYTDRRLFRLPNQHGICGFSKSEIQSLNLQYSDFKSQTSDAWNKWYNTYGVNNYHQFITIDNSDTIENPYENYEYIIKYVEDCEVITTHFTCNKKFKAKGTSGNFTTKNTKGKISVNLDMTPIIDSISKGFNTLAAVKEEIDIDSKIKVALLALEFNGKELIQNQIILLNKLNDYYNANQTYEGFEVRTGSKLSKQEVYQLIKLVFKITE